MTQMTPAQEPENLQEWLTREFQFDEDDLSANRSGVLSDKQKNVARDWRALFAVVGTCLISVGVLAVIGLESKSAMSAQPPNIAGLISAVGSGALVIAVGAFLIWLNLRSLRAARIGRVKCATGRVQFEEEKDGWYLCMGEIRLPVETGAKQLFSPDTVYRFYYSEIDKVVRSVEEV